jgi:HK97 family phage major capsid protein
MFPNKQYKALVQKRAELVAEGKAIFDQAEKEGRDLTADEKARDDAINVELADVGANLARHEARLERERTAKAPAFIRNPVGKSFAAAFQHWARTGEKAPLEDIGGDFGEMEGIGEGVTIRAASNATDMNIGTAADGGNTVPTGFYNRIVARRDESDLATRLPLLPVPTSGGGNAFDIPVDNEADGEFVATNEAADSDLDAPALDKKTATLVNYTKYTDVSYQLLRSTPTDLEGFLANFVGRGWAKTRNNLLLTEVAAAGTNFKTFASATAIAFGEPEDIVGNNDLAPYLDEDNAAAWVMRSSTHWDIKSIVGSDRQYADKGSGGSNKELLGYPVMYSQKAAAPAASAKPVYFGNWRYVAVAAPEQLFFMRDPYTVAIKNQVRLLWHFEIDFVVVQAEAIGYGLHPTG